VKKPKPKIGDVIKKARMRKKLTADDVAKKVNVSRSRVYQWEAAGFVMPKNLQGLSDVLGISLRRLKSVNGERRIAA
jgi:transcriptional regulator with XRE-family HTH domain